MLGLIILISDPERLLSAWFTLIDSLKIVLEFEIFAMSLIPEVDG